MKRTGLSILFLILFLLPMAAQSFTTWNVRILSDKSRDDDELDIIASILERSDFVALQELRDTAVLDRLMSRMPGWAYAVSLPVGRGVKEFYAFLYREDLFTLLGSPYTFLDEEDLFIREPFAAHFRTGNFDFTIVTIHSIYGDNKGVRRAEAALLDDVLVQADEWNGPEEDVILVGDFNLPGDDKAWEMTHKPLVPPDVKTTVTDTSSYDNIWIGSSTIEVGLDIEVFRFDEELFDNDDKAASRAVSDHRPVTVLLNSLIPDDDEEGNWDYPLSQIPRPPSQNE